MFTRIDLLPIYNSDERDRAQSRWDQASNRQTCTRSD